MVNMARSVSGAKVASGFAPETGEGLRKLWERLRIRAGRPKLTREQLGGMHRTAQELLRKTNSGNAELTNGEIEKLRRIFGTFRRGRTGVYRKIAGNARAAIRFSRMHALGNVVERNYEGDYEIGRMFADSHEIKEKITGFIAEMRSLGYGEFSIISGITDAVRRVDTSGARRTALKAQFPELKGFV